MNVRPADRPDYDRPPLVEVVLSLQFEPLSQFRVPHLGLLWQEFRSRYPRVEEHPPLQPAFETLPGGKQPRMTVEFQLLDAPPLPRLWFLDEPGNRLIQVQSDRFIHNWRKVGDGDAYPRYESIREAFAAELEVFSRFLDREQLGAISPNQCEITYVNHIEPGECWSRLGELHNVFSVWTPASDGVEPEDVRLGLRYTIADGGGLAGRLNVTIEPAFRDRDGEPILIMNLTARGRPCKESLEGALGFFDIARERIVRTFTALTTPCQHRVWGRRDVRSA
jgi:uncharacterized protein (TIGR04255 family)